MRRVDSIQANENLNLANDLTRVGVDFVCIPVFGKFTRKKLIDLLGQQLIAMEKEIEKKGESNGK